MAARDILWAAAGLTLAVLGALALVPGPLETPLPVTPPPAVGAAPDVPADWPARLEARLRPAVEVERRAVPEQALSGYTLVGLVQVDDRMLAIIAGHGATRTIALGAVLDGYEAVAIDDAGVVFERDGNNVVLRLAD